MSEADAPPQTLLACLRLESLGSDRFRAPAPHIGPGRIFGGQVVAQALIAAYETIEGRLCHSLHAYFVRPGDRAVPIEFVAERTRDGGSFSTRIVHALQDGRVILTLQASFMTPEAGLEHQSQPAKVPHWSELEEAPSLEGGPTSIVALRPVRAPRGAPETCSWARSHTPLGPDPRMHQAALVYISDMGILTAGMRPHGLHWGQSDLQSASLDHAVWFHAPSDLHAWHLCQHDSPRAAGGTALMRGAIYTEDGVLVASVAQEALMRIREARR